MGTGTSQAQSIRRPTKRFKMVKFLQLNLNHCRAAQDLLAQTIREKRIDVVIISEPCYIPPNIPLAEYTAIIEDIGQDAHGKSPVIIAGDFHAWATEWGSSRTTPRGTILLDILASLIVCLLNIGTRSTYSKAGRESIIDLTIASPDVARDTQWHVSDVYTHSDHFAVITDTSQLGRRGASRRLQHIGYKMDTVDLERLLPMVEGLGIRGDANSYADAIAETITNACDAIRKGGNSYRPVAWWNVDITKTPGIAPQLPANGINNCAPTDNNEVLSIAAKLKADKSPGPDGIPNGVIMGKIFERIICNRLECNAIQCTRWTGGTKHYCLVCTLDVRNAFNSANWTKILEALTARHIPGQLIRLVPNYFQDRVLNYDTEDGQRQYRGTGGVPQGSVLGPLLWNVMYDGLLRLCLPEGNTIIGIADDIAVVTVAKRSLLGAVRPSTG
ncbi:uncharacterized protein [Drosophila virilis]|uniref:uncharacterized protein n=1 Tax=Drosophila virilis TaxID=7244 RepID=UPI0038B3C67F